MKDESVVEKTQKEITASLLDAFDLLKSTKDDVKVLGGIKIITRLAENKNEKDIQYVLKRLVRSMGANIIDMRLGYCATLVSLIHQFEEINVQQLLDLVKKELHANGSSKSEVGDVALGQILVCGALFRSGLMLKSTPEEQKEILQLLQVAGNKKSYLSTTASIILLEFVDKLDEDQFSSIVWTNIKQDYKKDIKEHTLDSLYFLLVISKKFPEKVKLRKLIGMPEILHEDNISDICEKIMTGVDLNSINHPIYKEIATQISKSSHLMSFWNKIDSHLVKHNRNRELVSLNILNIILLNIQDNVAMIPDLITDNFFKLFMDWFKGLQTASKIRNKRDNEDDHKIVIKKEKEVLTSLSKALKLPGVDSNLRVATLKKLLFGPGEINFTEITGSTVIKSTIADLDIDGLKKLAGLLKKVLMNTSKKFIKENVERNWYNNERVKAAEIISFIVSHDAMKQDTAFKINHMQLLMCFGFFKISGDQNIAVSSELAGSIKTCFYRCFTSRFSNVDDLVLVLSSLTTFTSNIMNKEQVREKLEKQFSKENIECWEMLTGICKKIEQNDAKSKIDKVFLILLYQLGLFLFSEPSHVNIARSSITELKSCYEHYKKGKKKKTGKNKETIDEDEPEWMEVLIEVLLSILSIESSVLRSVVQCVFRLLWEDLTPTSMNQIISVLDPESEANPLRHDSESEDEEGDDENSDESDKESNDENKDTNETDMSDGSDIEEEDEEMKIPDQLRLAVQKALGTAAAPDTDAESIDADMISEGEGKKLDEALAEAFKQFHQGKNIKTKKDRKNKKALSDFRIRVLDLIDIYLEKDPAMDICLGMIAPLSRCLEFCMQDNQFKELENRVRKTIKNFPKIKKFSTAHDISVEILGDFLKSIIEKGDRSHFMYQALGDIITYFSIFIIHCSQKIPIKASKSSKKQNGKSPIIEIFEEAVENYFQNRNCLLPIIFFHNVLQTEWDGKYNLLPIIIKNIFNVNVRQFRRNEGLNLVIGFYQALNRLKPTSEQITTQINKIEKSFNSTFSESIKSENKIEVTSNFVATLKKLINIMRMFHENCKIPSNTNFKTLLDDLGSLKGIVKNPNKNETTKKQNGVKKTKKNKKNKRKREQSNGDHHQSEPEAKKTKDSSDIE
ncbi:myb-binding protein 1A-like protein [Vanessa tameamea]|uniref:Myb-binding protein 1A-like protein n=1 Tax=Vanessa tameamea TaxID=334116 RepID=A0A8B8HVK9_VANTA